MYLYTRFAHIPGKESATPYTAKEKTNTIYNVIQMELQATYDRGETGG